MAEENQILPILASSKVNPRSDEQFAAKKPKTTPHQKKSSKCLVYILSLIVIFSAITLILALTVLRPTTPVAKFSFIRVENLNFNANSSSPSFNITLNTELKINNKNFGRFDFENSTARFLYGDVVVGEVLVREGRVGSKESKFMNFEVKLRSNDRVLNSGRNLSSDLSWGILNLSSHGSLSGRVVILHLKKKRTAVMDCSMKLNLRNHSIQDLECN